MRIPVSTANIRSDASISGRDGKYDEPSMNRGCIARWSSSFGIRLFQSHRSYARVPRATGAYGLVHDRRRWKNGQRRNMPPGSSSAEIVAWATPRWGTEYDTWRPPGPLPTTTTG